MEQNLRGTPGQTGRSNQTGEITEQGQQLAQQAQHQKGAHTNRGSELTVADDRLGRVHEEWYATRLVRPRSSRDPSPDSVFWVVCAGERLLMRPLTFSPVGSKETLAVFSHPEEAEMFVRWLDSDEEGWRVRETSAGEVVSLLYGPRCGAKAVALDPFPEVLADGFHGLVTLERRRFVRWITGRKRDPPPPDAG